MSLRVAVLVLGILGCCTACERDEDPDTGGAEGFDLAGGTTTIFSAGPDAYTFPLANLDAEGVRQHFLADAAFGQIFVSAPSQQFGGVGPLFNQSSCENCHVRNGRSSAPAFDGDPNSGLLLRISVPGLDASGSPTPVTGFGRQLQTKAIFGTLPEGKIGITYTEELRRYVDGLEVSLRHPCFRIDEPYRPLPEQVLISPRMAPPVIGLGLLEVIDEAQVLAKADPDDHDGDGISGRPNWVLDVLSQKPALGRFGWKAEQPTAAQQAADAAHNDMGLTSWYFEVEHCDGQDNCVAGRQNTLDIDRELIDQLAFYFQTVAVPAARNGNDPSVRRGQALFGEIGCASCHTPQQRTGADAYAPLAGQTIYPYTDMLLHDMGEGLSDGRPSHGAEGREWRTAPLWGIGLTQVVNPRATFLHDGRARTIEEAVLWHGGEAAKSQQRFRSLTKPERHDLLTFLENL